jgi:uncharacterized membrane protein YsdA (DUF1294 family)
MAICGQTSPYAPTRFGGLTRNFNGRLLVQPGHTENSYISSFGVQSQQTDIDNGLSVEIILIAVLTSKVPGLILIIYLMVSLITYVAYAIDKSAAKKGAWRTQESTLHLLSLVGGWPGAVVAQKTLRHKSKKESFRAVFWMTVLLNCGLFAWLLTPAGSAALQSLIVNVT